MVIMQPTAARGPRSGLRANTGRMWQTIPIDGRIAMYTSGWPKNQNRCCQSSTDPPCAVSLRSPNTKPVGMKKLVPATRSRIRRMHAGNKTAKASKAMTEVTNQAHEQ